MNREETSNLQGGRFDDRGSVVLYHHTHPWYRLARFARRDAVALMVEQREKWSSSSVFENVDWSSTPQLSGGQAVFRKTDFSQNFALLAAAWSSQAAVIGGYNQTSKLSKDWPEYIETGRQHQCDQVVATVLAVQLNLQTYPWHVQGFGGGSDDAVNLKQRRAAGMSGRDITLDITPALRNNRSKRWTYKDYRHHEIEKELKQKARMNNVLFYDSLVGRVSSPWGVVGGDDLLA